MFNVDFLQKSMVCRESSIIVLTNKKNIIKFKIQIGMLHTKNSNFMHIIN